MPRLTGDQKSYIVRALAAYDTPTEVLDSVNEIFGITVSRQQVHRYDATRAGSKPAKKWIALFKLAREAFLKDVQENPVSNIAYRLRTMQKELEKARHARNPDLILRILEQAAKELGGVFTNHRTLSGPGGEAVPLLLYAMPDNSRDAPSDGDS